jgi:outer membrane protein TolC
MPRLRLLVFACWLCAVNNCGTYAVGQDASSMLVASTGPATQPPAPEVRGPTCHYSTRNAFELDYVLEGLDPAVVSEVQLWGTNDGGATWALWGVDEDRTSPVRVQVQDDAAFGFAIVVQAHTLPPRGPPAPGTPPEICVVVDRTPPRLELLTLEPAGADAGWRVAWSARDAHLGAQAVSLLLATQEQGPYQRIAEGLPPAGNLTFKRPVGAGNPASPIWLRVEIRDLAGHFTAHQQPFPDVQRTPGMQLAAFASQSANARTAELSDPELTRQAFSGRDAAIQGRSGQELSGQELSGQELSGQELSGQELSGQELSGQELSGQELSGQELSGQELSGQELSGQELSSRDILSVPQRPDGVSQDPARGLDVAFADAAPQLPWWSSVIVQTSLTGRLARPLSVDELIGRTLSNAAQLRVASMNPQIEETRVREARADFDLAQFVSTRWLDTSRPVGSELDTGGAGTRLNEDDLQTDFGIERRNAYGGRFEAFERLQLRNSNSNFFIPKNQGLTQMTMRYSQPLMRDRGTLVNTRQIVLAQYTTQAMQAASRAEVADYLLRTVEVYWDVYRNRANVAIQRRLYESTLELLRKLQKREQIDASSLMLVQAQTIASMREAELAAAEGELRRSQNELVRLVGDVSLDIDVELVPLDQPLLYPLQVDAHAELHQAVENRPEITEALQRIRHSQLTRQVQANQLLPQLTLVLDSTLYGLSGDFNIGRALGNQFSEGAPTYSAGLNFEYPWGNRAADARMRRAQLEYSREVASMVDTVQRVKLDVKNALVDLETLQQQIDIRYRAVLQATEEVRRSERRRELYPESDKVASLYLQDLLESQNRLASAERDYVQALTARSVAVLRLRRASGTLWQETPVAPIGVVPAPPVHVPPTGRLPIQAAPPIPMR